MGYIMADNLETRRREAKKEFKSIIATYMLPLFDVRGTLKCEDGPFINKELITFKEESNGKYIYFFPLIGTQDDPSPFCCKIGTYSSEALRRPATQILHELLKVTEYEYCGTFSVKRYYGKKGKRQISYKGRTLDLAFELGMCQWLVPTMDNAITLHTVICRMLEWSSRTYEGKNVPFGFVIDFNRTAVDGAADYLHFLENDSSAVFTDGIFSGILLDRSGKILSFLTRSSTTLSCKPHQEVLAWQKIMCKRNSTKSRMALWKQGGIWRTSLGYHGPGRGPRYARRRRECRGTLPGILSPGEFVSA